MRGKEVADMFGDQSLMELEQQQKHVGDEIDQHARELAEMKLQGEDGEEAYVLLEQALVSAREQLKILNERIRKSGKSFGQKRGPLTTH